MLAHILAALLYSDDCSPFGLAPYLAGSVPCHGWFTKLNMGNVWNLSCEKAELRYALAWTCSGWSDSPYKVLPSFTRWLNSTRSISSSRLFSDQPQNRKLDRWYAIRKPPTKPKTPPNRRLALILSFVGSAISHRYNAPGNAAVPAAQVAQSEARKYRTTRDA